MSVPVVTPSESSESVPLKERLRDRIVRSKNSAISLVYIRKHVHQEEMHQPDQNVEKEHAPKKEKSNVLGWIVEPGHPGKTVTKVAMLIAASMPLVALISILVR